MSDAGSASPVSTAEFQANESFATHMDEIDPLRGYRTRFHIPRRPEGEPVIYFCGNSLGLQPRGVGAVIEQELDDWARLGVDAHFGGRTPWYSYHEVFRERGARLVGARAGEVVMMNSLTVNLHLMMVSFFHPTAERHKIVMEYPAFPSDLYAVRTHLGTRGLDPDHSLVQLRPPEGEHAIRTEEVEAFLDEHGREVALVLLGGVNFFTGQVFDMARITAAARRAGCTVGLDLAHAAGNVVLKLHDWDVDFAVWCSYKYLNAGPGAVAGCFVHERHGRDHARPRFAGWWGDDPQTRFQMHLQRDFVPQPGAGGWQVSNPPILSMAPLRASLEMFDEAGMAALRRKSQLLTGYLRYLLQRGSSGGFEIITPVEPEAQGCQLSILVREQPKQGQHALAAEGVVCDLREPDVLRVAPVPLYNTFHEVWRFSRILLENA
ncbi:MAG: kynureninase [Planctomycetota bacterium]|jgi:kynureninase